MSHYVEILPLNEITKINCYVKVIEEKNLSIRELRSKIKSKEYERLDDKLKDKLINYKKIKIEDIIPNPIIIKSKISYEIVSEKILQQIILENLESFMKELGDGFTFVGSEYKIKIGNNYNFIDILLFNVEFNCYVVVELKITELKKGHIGQVQVHMNYINKNVKKNISR